MANVILYDANGDKIDLAKIKETVAAPTPFGVRRLWNNSVASGLTPSRLAQILQSAEQGETEDYFVLAHEMERRDGHLRAVLGTRRSSVASLTPIVTAKDDSAKSKQYADEVRAIVTAAKFRAATQHCTDGLGKGYAVVEKHWDTSSTPWRPVDYEYRKPQWFGINHMARGALMLRDDQGAPSIPLPYGKFIVHRPILLSGNDETAGLAYTVAWAYMFKWYSAKDWMAFCEIFGMPVRIGSYGPSASKDDIDTLVDAVRSIGAESGAVIPESMKIDIEEAGANGSSPFEALCNYWDKQMSKAILGQTMTTDDGASLSQSQTHEKVRQDLRDDDAKDLASTLQTYVVEPYIALNYGQQDLLKYGPTITLPVPRPQDIQMTIDGIDKMAKLGMRFSKKGVHQMLGTSEPDDDNDALVYVQPQAQPAAPDIAANATRTRRQNIALNAQGSGDATQAEGDVIEQEIVDRELAKWQVQMDPILDPLLKRLEAATTFEEAQTVLAEVAAEMDDSELVKRLGRALFDAYAIGRATR